VQVVNDAKLYEIRAVCVCFVGVVAALASVSMIKARYWLLMFSSLVYLTWWALSATLQHAGLVEGMRLKYSTAIAFGWRWQFYAYDLLLPAVFLTLFLFSVQRQLSTRISN
jgi:hypothetical protein